MYFELSMYGDGSSWQMASGSQKIGFEKTSWWSVTQTVSSWWLNRLSQTYAGQIGTLSPKVLGEHTMFETTYMLLLHLARKFFWNPVTVCAVEEKTRHLMQTSLNTNSWETCSERKIHPQSSRNGCNSLIPQTLLIKLASTGWAKKVTSYFRWNNSTYKVYTCYKPRAVHL